MTDIDTKELRRRIEQLRAAEELRRPWSLEDLERANIIRISFSEYALKALPALLSEAEEAARLREELAALRAAPAAEPVAPEEPTAPDDAWLIRKRGYFYRPNFRGYTARKDEAGRYTEAEAKAEEANEPKLVEAIRACDVPDAAPPAPVADGERDRYRRAAEFAAKMAWREDPPNAHQKLTDSERLSAIKHHPDIKALAAAPTEAGR